MENTLVNRRFSLGFYVRSLSQLLVNPSRFFSELPVDMGMGPPLSFLLLSSLVFTLSSLMNAAVDPLTAGMIFFANAVGMVFITSGLGYGVMVMTIDPKTGYVRFFTIYALSSGVTLLAAWMPYFLFITEPWKWWLIFTGLTRGLQLKWQQALTVIGLSVALLLLGFWMILPLISTC